MNGIVLGGSLKCRKSASTSAGYYGTFPNGTILSVTAVSGTTEWYQTTWTNGSIGYVMRSFVACNGDTVAVDGSNVNVRSGPSTGYEALYRVNTGATATVIGMTTDWVNISSAGQPTGWIHADYVEKSGNGNTSGGGTTGSITDDGSTGDSTNTYSNAKCIGNIYVYERDNPYDLLVLQYYGKLSGDITVNDAGSTEWFNFSNDGMVYRKQVDITYCKKPATVTMGSSTLRNGSSGRYVYHLQHYLNRYLASRNYAKMAVDGQFGSTTQAKVESFQQYWNSIKSVKLDVDGVVGANTRTALAQYVHGL